MEPVLVVRLVYCGYTAFLQLLSPLRVCTDCLLTRRALNPCEPPLRHTGSHDFYIIRVKHRCGVFTAHAVTVTQEQSKRLKRVDAAQTDEEDSSQTQTLCCSWSFLALVLLLMVIECDDLWNRFLVCLPCSISTVTETTILRNCIVYQRHSNHGGGLGWGSCRASYTLKGWLST